MNFLLRRGNRCIPIYPIKKKRDLQVQLARRTGIELRIELNKGRGREERFESSIGLDASVRREKETRENNLGRLDFYEN